MANVKEEVRQFYDQVGWQAAGEGLYQNARYEDLRRVSREYIHRCHLRVGRFLRPSGRYLLDAGSGPVQYLEYLTYSQGYTYRVCADLSIMALRGARNRLGKRGLYVVADVANLPFKPEAFEGVVSLHTLHHLPPQDHRRAYGELHRVLAPGCRAVVVNGWMSSPLMQWTQGFVRLMERLGAARERNSESGSQKAATGEKAGTPSQPAGTFVQKYDAGWLARALAGCMRYEVRCWRSVSVRFLRALVHERWGGRFWLRLLFWLEELFPHWFGVNGQYPLVIIYKD